MNGGLRIACKDNVSTAENLLEMDNSVTVQRNLQLLMVEICKTKYNLNPSFMKQIFEEKEIPHNLRCSNKLQLPKVNNNLPWNRYSQIYGDRGMGDTTSRDEKSDFVQVF